LAEPVELKAVPGFGFLPNDVVQITNLLFQEHLEMARAGKRLNDGGDGGILQSLDPDSETRINLDQIKCEQIFVPGWRHFFPELDKVADQAVCAPVWDGASCIPPTLAGNTAILPCMNSYEGIFYSPKYNSSKECLANGTWSGPTDYYDCMCKGSDQHVNDSVCNGEDSDNPRIPITLGLNLAGYSLSLLALLLALMVYLSLREMRCLRHKIHMGLFCTFGLSALNWILTLSWKNLVSPELAEPLLCTTFTLTYFFHLTSFYWMFLEGFYLFLQVQFPLSLTWIKYKHFLFFGLGGPIANTLVWFALRVQDQFANLQGDSNNTQPYYAEELRGDLKEHGHNDTSGFSNWQDSDKPLVCLFVEDKQMDVWVMQVPMLIILVFNTLFLIWVILIVILKLRQKAVTAADHDRRHWKAAKALIFVMPLLGVGYVMTLVVRPTVRSIGVPLLVAVSDAMEAVITSTQGFVISLPYCFLNSEVQGVVRSHWSRWRMVRTVGKNNTTRANSVSTNATYYINQKSGVQV